MDKKSLNRPTTCSGNSKSTIQNLKWWGIAIVFAFTFGGAVAVAQQPKKIPRIGALLSGSPSNAEHYVDAFRHGLRELGYVERQTIAVEYLWAEGRSDRFDELAAKLVRDKVDVLLVWGTTAVTAAKHATTTIPIVFVAVGDPVGSGIIASLARPDGNVTGLSTLGTDLAGKRLELLKEIKPRIARVAVLRNRSIPSQRPC